MALNWETDVVKSEAWILARLDRTVIVACGLCALLLGCQAKKSKESEQHARQVSTLAGPSEAQKKRLFHLAEGSEFVPYCALKVLAKENHLTVSAYFEGYHLIPDATSETNPLGLPIGVTVTNDRLRLVGFNCAACHVGQIAGAPGPIVGAPSHFDIRAFYDGLIPWLSNLTSKPKLLSKVVGCMLLGSKGEANPEPAAEEVMQELDASLEPSAPDAGVVTDLYDHLEEAASAPNSSAVARGVERATASAASSSKKLQELPKPKRQSVIKSVLGRFIKQKELLKARINSLETVRAVGALQPTTVPGPGRVDAFMTALNLMNPKAELPMTSPVAFPQLWGVSRLNWLHWDNNTNATLQRNMGQAIGVGAVTVEHGKDLPEALGSTLDVRALMELESIVRTIQPPRWPFAVSDAKLVASGRELYDSKCARCHEPAKDGSMPDLPQTENIGTDEQRLKNFRNEKAGAKPIDLLSTQLAAVERGSTASEAERDKGPKWRTTNQYGVRSLQGVWATAPYLHNDSVPTLADLLSPAESRPKTFTLDYSRYDVERVGFKVLDRGQASAQSFELDTSKAGNGNAGHSYGTELSAEEKLSLLAYLKQL